MSVRRTGVFPTKMMPAAYAGADPVRGRVERQIGMACVAIQNNGEALYEPQNPSFLICNPYEDPQARLARKECAENGCDMTDAEFAATCFFAEEAWEDSYEEFFGGEEFLLSSSACDEMIEQGLAEDDGQSCTLTEAGLAAVYGEEMPLESDDYALENEDREPSDMPFESDPADSIPADDGSPIVSGIDTMGAFNAAASADAPESALAPAPDIAPVAPKMPAANAASFALRA